MQTIFVVLFCHLAAAAGGEGLLLLNLLYAGEGSALGELATFISRVEGAALSLWLPSELSSELPCCGLFIVGFASQSP